MSAHVKAESKRLTSKEAETAALELADYFRGKGLTDGQALQAMLEYRKNRETEEDEHIEDAFGQLFDNAEILKVKEVLGALVGSWIELAMIRGTFNAVAKLKETSSSGDSGSPEKTP